MSENTSNPTPHNEDIQGFDDPSPKFPKWVKWMGGTALGLVLLAGGAGVIATGMIDQEKYKSLIIEKVDEATGYSVNWKGDIAISLLPLPHVTVSELTVSANNQNILSIKSADVEVALMPLLSKKIEIQDVTLEEPQINLVTLKAGTQTWLTDKIGKASSSKEESGNSESSQKAEEQASGSTPMEISLNIVEITDGRFVWDDQSKGEKQAAEDLDIRLKAESLTGPFEVNGGTLWNGHKIEAKINTTELDLQNGLYPVQIKIALPQNNIQAEYSGTITQKQDLKVEGDVSVETSDIESALASLSNGNTVSFPEELAGKSRLSGKLNVSPKELSLLGMQLELGQLAYSGNLKLEGLDKEGSLPQVSFDIKSNAKADANASSLIKFMDDLSVTASGTMKDSFLVINQSKLQVESNDLSLKGNIGFGDKKQIDLTVTSQKIDIDQITKKLGVADASPSESSGGLSSATGANSSDKKLGMALPFEGRLKANVKQIIHQGKSYEDIAVDINAKEQSLQVSKLEAKLPENIVVKASGSIGNTENLSAIDMHVNAKIADVEKTALTYGVTLPETPRKIGAASIDGDFKGDMKAMSFNTTFGVWGFSFGGTGKVASLLDNPVINQLSFKVTHPNLVEAMQIVQPSFSGSSTLTGAMDVSGEITWGDNQYLLKGLDAKLGKTTVAGDMDIAASGKPSVTGDIKIGNLALPTQEGSSKASSSASKASSSQSNSGGSSAKWSREAIDVSWMKNFNADLKISAQSLSYDLWNFQNANLEFALQDGALNIADMSANLFGGRANLSGQIKSGAGDRDPLSIMGKLNAENVDAQRLVSAATGKPNKVFSGIMSKVDVSVDATGLSPAALVQTLNGEGSVEGRDIVVQGVDAAQLAMAAKGSYKPMERAGTLFGSFGEGKTEFSTFVSEFVIQNGVVNLTKTEMDGPKAKLISTGNINLPQWTINLKNSMTVKETDIPPFEFTIKGPLDNPAKAGGDVIENYLRGKYEKKVNKLIENQLNKFLGGGEDKTAPTQESAPTPTQDGAQPVEGSAAPITEKASAPAQEKVNPKDALKKDALKALGGLLGGQ